MAVEPSGSLTAPHCLFALLSQTYQNSAAFRALIAQPDQFIYVVSCENLDGLLGRKLSLLTCHRQHLLIPPLSFCLCLQQQGSFFPWSAPETSSRHFNFLNYETFPGGRFSNYNDGE